MLAEKPLTISEIAAYYGVSVRTVRRWLKRAGLDHLCTRRGTGSNYYTLAELRTISQALGD